MQWLEKGTAWDDPANWSTGQVPGIGDIACFTSRSGKVAKQPIVAGTDQVGGLYFDNGRARPNGPVPGAKLLHSNPSPTWIIQGSGTLAIGPGGIAYSAAGGTDVIHPNLELLAEQDWAAGRCDEREILDQRIRVDQRRLQMIGLAAWSLPNYDCYGNGSILAILGKISGPGGIHKKRLGHVYYANSASPTFEGGTWVECGTIEWNIPPITSSDDYTFGTKPIVLDAGTFCFGSAVRQNKQQVPSLITPIRITSRNGILEYSQEGPDGAKVPDSRFAGPIELGGRMKIEHATNAGPASKAIQVGPVTLDQSQPGTLGMLAGDFNSDRYGDMAQFLGKVVDGPGDAGNPLILSNYAGSAWMGNAGSTYAGGTIIGYCGIGMNGQDYWRPRICIEPDARLGSGDLTIEPGGCVLLTSPTNLSPDAVVTIRSSPVADGVLDLGFDELPKISKDSHGVIAFDGNDFDAFDDLSALGDGYMSFSSSFRGPINWPAFSGKRLAPGKGNVYRFGGGYAPIIGNGSAQKLRIRYGVLVGSAGLEIGSRGFHAYGSVRLDSANTFTGPITVRGGPRAMCDTTTVLQGRVQSAGDPFGDPAGPVSLYDAEFSIANDADGDVPVRKGTVTFDGHCILDIYHLKKPATLSLADIKRAGDGLLDMTPLQGDDHIAVTGWTKDIPLLPPFICCGYSFAAFDAATGIGPFKHYQTSLTTATADDVVSTGALALRAHACKVKAPPHHGADHRHRKHLHRQRRAAYQK